MPVLLCDHQEAFSNTAVATNVFPWLQSALCQARTSLCVARLLGGSPEERLHKVDLGSEFMALTPKASATKQKPEEDGWPPRSFCTEGRPTQRQPQKGGEYASHVVDGLTQDMRDSCRPPAR